MSGRVLITGAGGLIGRQTIAPLKDQGFHVVALGRAATYQGADDVIQCDLLDDSARKAGVAEADCSHLVHLAWHDEPANRWTAPQNVDWAAATLSLVREFAAAGGTRVVAAGSCAEYDWSFQELREDTPLAPSTLYGHAKATTGAFLTSAAGDLGLSLCWARVFFCYGPNEPKGRLLGDLIHGLSRGEIIETTDGLQERDFLHTADIGRALAMLAQSDITGPVNVSSGKATKVRDLVLTAAKLAGREDLVRLGARARPGHDPECLVGPNERLQSIGFRAQIGLQNGLAACLGEMAQGDD